MEYEYEIYIHSHLVLYDTLGKWSEIKNEMEGMTTETTNSTKTTNSTNTANYLHH